MTRSDRDIKSKIIVPLSLSEMNNLISEMKYFGIPLPDRGMMDGIVTYEAYVAFDGSDDLNIAMNCLRASTPLYQRMRSILVNKSWHQGS